MAVRQKTNKKLQKNQKTVLDFLKQFRGNKFGAYSYLMSFKWPFNGCKTKKQQKTAKKQKPTKNQKNGVF